MQIRIAYSLSLQLENDLQTVLTRIISVQTTIDACCDFTSQCIIVGIKHSSCIYHPFYSPESSKIYRCWIVWGKNIRVVIIPSFLAITLLGKSIFLHLISQFQLIASSYLAIVNPWISDRYPLHFASNRFGRVHGREYPGDGYDRVQNPQHQQKGENNTLGCRVCMSTQEFYWPCISPQVFYWPCVSTLSKGRAGPGRGHFCWP